MTKVFPLALAQARRLGGRARAINGADGLGVAVWARERLKSANSLGHGMRRRHDHHGVRYDFFSLLPPCRRLN